MTSARGEKIASGRYKLTSVVLGKPQALAASGTSLRDQHSCGLQQHGRSYAIVCAPQIHGPSPDLAPPGPSLALILTKVPTILP